MRAILAVSILALAAGIASPGLAQKKILTVGMGSADTGPLDPHLNATTPGKGVMNWMFNGLVRIKPGQASPEFIEPDLAESWSSNATGTEWTFKIRAGAQCHHGFGEFTAEDAAFSVQRAATKATSSFSSDFAALDKAEATDKSTLKLTLKNPVPGFLGYLANYHGGNMICKKAAEAAGENFKNRPIGTGPFQFVEAVPQQHVKLQAHKGYFRGAPQLEEIMYRLIPSDAARDLAFQAGEIDLVYGKQEQSWVDRISKLPNTKVAAMEPAELSVLHLNTRMKPLDDIRVRQALMHALDRKAMVAFKGPGTSREAVSLVPSGYLGTFEKAPLLGFDMTKAKALLAEAGFPNGVTVKTIHTTLSGMQTVIEAVQGQWKRAGINLDIELVEHATFHAQIRKDLSPIVHYAAARFPVADVYLTQFFHSRSSVNTPTAVTNFNHCAMADQDIEAARVEPDKARQLALWHSAQDKLVKNICAIPIFELLQLWAWKDSLDFGYEPKGSLNLSPPITEATRFVK